MNIVSYGLEFIAYMFKIVLLLSFWFIVFYSIHKKIGISKDSSIIRIVSSTVNPLFRFLRNRLPYLVKKNIDFTPILSLFIIILLHLIVVDTLLGIAVRLK